MLVRGRRWGSALRLQFPERALQRMLLACVAGISVASAGCGARNAAKPPAFGPAAVITQVATPLEIPVSSTYLATLKSRHTSSINPQVEGWITKIFVQSGEHVASGAPLLEIDPRMQEASVNSQEAARNAMAATLENAQAQYARGKQLYDAGIISKQDFDTYKTAYDNAAAQTKSLDAQVREQQVQLHYYTVTAPTGGIVGDIPVHVGDRVTNTTLLTTVDELGALQAYIYVPVDHSQELHRGEDVNLLDDAGKVIARSQIFFVSPQVDDTTQTVLAKALIPNPADKLRTEQFVRAQIIWRMAKGLTIPVLAVSRINGQFFVFLAEKSEKGLVARQVQVQLGDIIGNNYVVESGIKPGDHVIVAGFAFLADGTPVKETIQNSAPEAPPH